MADDFSVGSATPKRGGILSRKVLGIPVLYIAIVLVLALAFYAWRAKSSSDSAPAADTGDDTADEGGAADVSALYPIAPTGTVYAGQPQSAVTDNAEYYGNAQWLAKAVMGMAAKGKSPGEVQIALQAYLNGDHLTYDQAMIRDQAIKDHGFPPETFTAGTADGKPVPAPAPVVNPTPAPAPAPANPRRLRPRKSRGRIRLLRAIRCGLSRAGITGIRTVGGKSPIATA